MNRHKDQITGNMAEARMAVASALEDYADARLFAFIEHLKDQEYLSEEHIHEALSSFDENLQYPPRSPEDL